MIEWLQTCAFTQKFSFPGVSFACVSLCDEAFPVSGSGERKIGGEDQQKTGGIAETYMAELL